MTPKWQRELRPMFNQLIERANATGGPDAGEIHLAFTDADDYPDFDEDAAANYLIGWFLGVSAATGHSVDDLLRMAVEA